MRPVSILSTFVAAGVVVLAAACGPVQGDGSPTSSEPSTTAPAPTTTTAPAPTTTTGPPAPTTTPPPATTTTETPTTSAPPVFAWSAATLDPATRALMTGTTWRAGCPVPLDDLRLVNLSYWGFDGAAHMGQLVVNADSVAPVVGAFRALYQARFPIRRMRLVDYYGGDDERSMAADNTSAFNCRLVPGSTTWSQHAYGRAVDVDPLENPEIRNGNVDPPSGWPWADRTGTDPAMIHHGDAAWRAFVAVGWRWGGDWSAPKDYQHFSANGL